MELQPSVEEGRPPAVTTTEPLLSSAEKGSPAHAHRFTDMVKGVLRYTVQSANSLVAAEFWVVSTRTPVIRLARMPGAVYVDPAFVAPTPEGEEILQRFASSEDVPESCSIGVGLAGGLWTSEEPCSWHTLDQLANNPEATEDVRSVELSHIFGVVAGVPFGGGTHTSEGVLIVFARATAVRD